MKINSFSCKLNPVFFTVTGFEKEREKKEKKGTGLC